MHSIISYTEEKGNRYNKQHLPLEGTPNFLADSICYHASNLAQQVGAKAIIAFTHSGYTAIKLSSHRANSNIIAFTNNQKLVNKISLIWGIRTFYLESYDHLDEAISDSIEILKKYKLLSEGDCVVHVGSTPLELHGRTNLLTVRYI
jgi:pyruvate kinase